MRPPPLEHDYIGLSEVSSNGSSTSNSLKQTELRLGLPGSESPTRVTGSDLTLSITPNTKVKRGFSDALVGPANNNSNKWVFSSGSEVKELFSPKNGENNSNNPGLVKDAENKKVNSQAPPAKAQVVGWPPIRSYRKNTMATTNQSKNKDDGDGKQGAVGCLYVKVSMDGAPYLRKVDLKNYSNYKELSSALEKMFSCFTIGQFGSHGMPTRDGLSESRMTELIDRSENVLTYEDKDGDWMLVGDVPWEMFTETCRRLRIMKGSDAIGLAPRASGKGKNWN